MAGNPWPNQSIWREWYRLHLPICTYMKGVSPAISKEILFSIGMAQHSTQHFLCQQLELDQLDMLSYATVSYTHVVSRPRPNKEIILDVVQEGQSLKLGVGWRARLFVPTCKNSKHWAYMSLLNISRKTGVKEMKRTRTLEARVRPS